MKDIHNILKQYWGYTSFRPLQEDIIRSILDGHDTLALMPTGGGKSICYQVPAMARKGLCLVISPLIALMKDQVESLQAKKITAFSIFSGMTRREVYTTLKTASESNCKFLFVSPERLETALFKEFLPGLGITLIAVDEAHCVSQWGYDFRPPYLRIAALREELPHVPVLALTASATPPVQEDICTKLAFSGHRIFKQSFERPNLSYSVFKVDARINKIADILAKVPGTAIVYCKSRKRTKEISDQLCAQQMQADFYHAGLPQELRARKQQQWISGQLRIIVCTNAFGMGIDKPDVRCVIHADVPDCLENYYQEAGRGGRDGKTAYAVLLYDDKELADLEKNVASRFPSLTDIRNVYQSIANYLQLPTGTGAGEYFDFDTADFIRKFKLGTTTVIYSLKALEQEGWLALNEQVFKPSTVRFTMTRDFLHRFETAQPALEPLIKTLLRSYEGIFDYPVNISEKMLAGITKEDAGLIKDKLLSLHQSGVIEYLPQKDTPQLLFLRPRVKTDELVIDLAAFHRRRAIFEARVQKITSFVHETQRCRSQVIASYFGDPQVPACGICDNCLRRKAGELTKEEFEQVHQSIVSLVKEQSLSSLQLLERLKGIRKEKIWKVLGFLQSENKIVVDKKGMISTKA